MMSPEERRERGTALCRRLAADVASIAPPGLGAWAPAWGIVAEADVAFMVVLTAWEAEPSEPARLRVRDAYHRVLERWREAATRYGAALPRTHRAGGGRMMLALSPSALRRYDALLHLLADVGRGGTMRDLADAYALAGALEASEPDPDTLATLTARLGIEVKP